MKNHKAQIEVSFHWIFILIAGAAILAFFLIITKHEKESADINIEGAVGERLEALFSTIQQMPDSINNETLRPELEFRCEADGHTYTLKGGERRFNLYSQVIFSPETVGDGRIITWTKIYSTPFPAAQILYLSDEKTQYIFVKEDAENLYKILPELYEKKLVPAEEVQMQTDQGFRKYVIITKNDVVLDSSMTKKTTIVKITSEGEINFKNLEGTATRKYSNQETLFGAIITGNPELYDCAMEKLMLVSRITSEINLERTEHLEDDTDDRCYRFYAHGIPVEYLQSIIGNSTYPPASDYAPLNQVVTSLSILNRDMARANCPTIY